LAKRLRPVFVCVILLATVTALDDDRTFETTKLQNRDQLLETEIETGRTLETKTETETRVLTSRLKRWPPD